MTRTAWRGTLLALLLLAALTLLLSLALVALFRAAPPRHHHGGTPRSAAEKPRLRGRLGTLHSKRRGGAYDAGETLGPI